ncbi:potassium transporter TrkA [Rhizorhabdus dicambivorans]|uniref:Potassium transporter TrkA n=1 Tax=Rhizorhabdus dicambivorans TaxID=1850238 RepID=A0A2A4FU12_9SPHN|nr:potassium transporter TrkA [Rhizorhabdus dicambivorans]PCE41657.1 potassium transporter TrkA [Rhizorhabdus dicambivorans]
MRQQASAPSKPLTLRRRSRTPVWLSLLWRVLLALALIAVALAGHWFDRDGLRDNIDGAISFVDVLYFTMITVTTVGYGDIVPVTDQARMFDTFVVTPVRLFVWLIFLGTAYEFLFKHVWERWRMSVIQSKLRGHVVVAGYGTSGAEAVSELVRRGTDPAEIVVIDGHDQSLAAAEAIGANIIDGDATRNATLEAVQVARARAILVSAGRDDTSILIVLTARRLAPDVPISVVIRSEDNEALARQAGADTVINPASFAGMLLAGSTHGPHIADYMADLANAGGQVSLRERTVTAQEVGKSLSAISTGLGLRIYRAGACHGFWEPEVARLEAGDLIVEVVPR